MDWRTVKLCCSPNCIFNCTTLHYSILHYTTLYCRAAPLTLFTAVTQYNDIEWLRINSEFDPLWERHQTYSTVCREYWMFISLMDTLCFYTSAIFLQLHKVLFITVMRMFVILHNTCWGWLQKQYNLQSPHLLPAKGSSGHVGKQT